MATWTVYKFGGTSMGSAERITSVAGIVGSDLRARGGKLAVVVSAMSGVTDALVQLPRLAVERSTRLSEELMRLKEKHCQVGATLLPANSCTKLSDQLDLEIRALGDVLKAVSLVRECSDRTRDFVSGLGEVWSATILSGLLRSKGFACEMVDARRVLCVEPGPQGPTILWDKSADLFNSYRNSEAEILVITGFVCRTPEDVPATLGRNGSDYSAAIFGSLLDAQEIVIWTDVDGVMSADPRRVKDALVIPQLTYREAIELANFGAKVLHPGTVVPAVAKGIPILIKNTFHPNEPGSRIQHEATAEREFVVKGCATMDEVAVVILETTGFVNLTSVAARVFSALHEQKIQLIVAALGAPGNSLSIAVPRSQGVQAKKAIENTLLSEKYAGQIVELKVEESRSLLAIVGDGMAGQPGISARFFVSLERANVNVKTIIQGASERNISVLLDSADTTRALRAAHAGFYLSPQTLSVAVLGTGHVGSALLEQLRAIAPRLKGDLSLDIRIRAIANSSKMYLPERECDLGEWQHALANCTRPTNIDELVAHIKSESLPHVVIIDCTPSVDIAAKYASWIKDGIHIITPNRAANATTLAEYRSLQHQMHVFHRHYLYESSVCAGLPIIETLADLVQTGDEIIEIEGIFSGTISQILSQLQAGRRFGEVAEELLAHGMSERDLVAKLVGADMREKVLVLAREAGMAIEPNEVEIEPLVPESMIADLPSSSLDEHFMRLSAMGSGLNSSSGVPFSGKQSEQRIVQYVGTVRPQEGAKVRLAHYPINHPFARVAAGDCIVAFRTKRYNKQPLIVQGPGAGPEVTAAGVFADLLRLTRYLGGIG